MPCVDYLDTNKLDHNSSPFELFQAFVPFTLMDKWCTYINTKALRENAGQEGQVYPDFKPFNCREFCQHIRVYLAYSISPSPHIDMKFKLQIGDMFNGNNFVS